MAADCTRRPGAQQWVPDTGNPDDLRSAATACRGCELWEPATQVMFSAGAAGSEIALIGEQPGDVEDRRGVMRRSVEDVAVSMKRRRWSGRVHTSW